ncbi:2-nitropropane dioxygenase [Salinisphaera orenii MK-B5]|uniref:2-nitropropane dioxygenase n=1 Tax=Salinisphaera orenii MK-B5 TaxID=856730 RepID=A0A423PHA2_9GAMM|nr:nitronate monooxygenase [Salinisphaera orenii]ROO25001.1 2-nitropropane dioxygenase [Salinisphaera orenii MK-B5]
MARHDAAARALPDTICGLQRGARTKRQQTLAAGVPGITFSWGCSSALIARVHGAGAIAGVQIGSAAGAERALDAGADFLICQGVEAGGHVQSTLGLMALLERTRTVVGDATPIVAAGGLATGADIAAVRARGAVAAMLGTRFVATRESAAHPVYCRALLDADAQDTARTLCFDGGWSGAVHRVLRNDTLEAWEAAGCPPAGCRPGEGGIIAYTEAGAPVYRYDDTPAMVGMTGRPASASLFAGCGVGAIDDVPEAGALVARLGREFRAAERVKAR